MSDISKKRSTATVVRDFWSGSTLHGLPRIVSAEETKWKLFWLFMFMVMITGCSYQMWDIFTMFYARETTVSVSLGYGRVAFPAITLCNINPLKESSLLAARHNLTYVSTDDIQQYQNEKGSQYRVNQVYYIMSELTREEKQSLGHQQEDMISWSYYYDAKDHSMSHTPVYSKSVSTLYGNCYTFNTPATLSEELLASGEGANAGLVMYLYSEADDYMKSYNVARGFVLDVYPYNGRSEVDTKSIAIATGQYTMLALTQTARKRLEPPYGECDQEYADSFKDIYGYDYTVHACNQSCLHYLVAQHCECYNAYSVNRYSKEQLATLPMCMSYEQTQCMDSFLYQTSTNHTTSCTCPLPCSEVTYTVDASINMLDEADTWHHFEELYCLKSDAHVNGSTCMKMKNYPEDRKALFVSKNFACICIYFKDLVYETYTETITYGRAQFIADFGGNLGLWLGASIFSVLELLELFAKLGGATGVDDEVKRRVSLVVRNSVKNKHEEGKDCNEEEML